MSTIKGKNILIVDDDKDLTDLFKKFLEYDVWKRNLCYVAVKINKVISSFRNNKNMLFDTK
jgi:hypothetical protein